MSDRHHNDGLRKLCDCARRNWPKCSHPWHFNFKPRGGPAWRFSLDTEVGKRLATKDAAEIEADRIRSEIRAGTFVRAADRRKHATAAPVTRADAITVEAFAAKFVDHKAKPSGKKTWANDKYMLARMSAYVLTDGVRLGDKPIGAITEDDLEAFHASLRVAGKAASTRNQYVQLIKAAFRWAAKKGYVSRTPISADAEDSTLKRTKIARRNRRLWPDVFDAKGKLAEAGEERRLPAATTKNPGMQRLIVAALETACRRGELFALTWADIDLQKRQLRVRAETAKDAEQRLIPISDNLAAILEMAKTDPAGETYKAHQFVFGDCGEPVKNTKHAWENACTRAGIEGLHFHDLRHEAGSRWLESKAFEVHKIRAKLGHADLSTTTTYLNDATIDGLEASMPAYNRSRCNPVAIGTVMEHPLDRNGDTDNEKEVTVN